MKYVYTKVEFTENYFQLFKYEYKIFKELNKAHVGYRRVSRWNDTHSKW